MIIRLNKRYVIDCEIEDILLTIGPILIFIVAILACTGVI